jgi:hypothetical protein
MLHIVVQVKRKIVKKCVFFIFLSCITLSARSVLEMWDNSHIY